MGEISGVPTTDINNVDGFYTTQSGGGSGTASTTPTITLTGGTFGACDITVTNHSSYTNPNYECIVTAGATTTVSDANVDHGLESSKEGINDTMSFIDSNTATGTRTVTVKAQEFGDFVQSSGATATFNVGYVQNQYLRFRGVTSAGANTSARIAIDNIRLFTGAGQTGTEYPTTSLSSNTSETGIVISAGHTYSSSYAPWKAADSSNSTMYWSLSTNSTNNWWGIQFETATYATPPTIKSIQIRFDGQTQTGYFSIAGSNTGTFTGEETDYGVFRISAENTSLNFG